MTVLPARKALTIALVAVIALLAACSNDATVASQNVSKAADNFEVNRRIVMFNGITGEYLLEATGRCSITDQGNQLEVICKTGQDEFRKHFLGLADNVSYFVEQGDAVRASDFRYRITFKPAAIVPDVDFRSRSADVGGGEATARTRARDDRAN